ncbi:MAG: pitrilysin family protein [Deltaproteobacteria bacterium]|nr:pitrilysin family protein [Deltaproteobacteria bacterium]
MTILFLFPLSLLASPWTPPKVSVYELPNGFQLYLLQNSELPILQAKLFVQTGSAYEKEKTEGLADVVADLLAMGGTADKTPAELDQWLDAKAIHLSGDAGRELTQITVSSLAKEWESLFSILHEVVTAPRWDKDRFDLIIGRTKEGLRREKDHPQILAGRALRKMVYGEKNPWGRQPTVKSIGRIRPADINGFYKKYYHPNRMLLAVAGDFSKPKVKKWVEGHFGLLVPQDTAAPDWKKIPLDAKRETKRIKKKVTQAFIEAGHIGLERGSPDEYAFSLLQYILGGDPFISRLGVDIRSQSGLAYSVYSNWETNPAGGMFSIHVQTRSDAEKAVLEKIDFHLKRMAVEADVTGEELKIAKEALLNKYIFLFDSPFKVVFQKATFDLLGYPKDYLKKYPENIRKVTLAEVQAAAKRYLHPDNLKIVVVSP